MIKEKISVVLPTYNERDNILNLIKALEKAIKNPEIIVVDDNSPDKTWQVAKNLNKKNVKVIRRVNERGLPSAIAYGISKAKGDVIIWMDCDLSHPPKTTILLINALKDADIAIGSRYVKFGADKRKFIRTFTSKLFNMFASFLLNLKVKDTDSGFIAAKKEVFNKVSIYQHGYGEYFLKFMYDAQRKGFKIVEVPFINHDRTSGESKTGENLLEMLKQGYNYITGVIKIRLNILKYK